MFEIQKWVCCILFAYEQTLKNMLLYNIQLRYDSKKTNKTHDQKSYSIPLSNFCNDIQLWITFHFLIIDKTDIFLPH